MSTPLIVQLYLHFRNVSREGKLTAFVINQSILQALQVDFDARLFFLLTSETFWDGSKAGDSCNDYFVLMTALHDASRALMAPAWPIDGV